MIMILSVAILILVAYIFSQQSEIKSLKTRIARLNGDLNDTQRVFNRFSAEIDDLKEENATLHVHLSDLKAEMKYTTTHTAQPLKKQKK